MPLGKHALRHTIISYEAWDTTLSCSPTGNQTPKPDSQGGQYLPECRLAGISANCKSLATLRWDKAEADDPLFTSDQPASLRLINILLPSKHSKLGFPRIETINSLVELIS